MQGLLGLSADLWIDCKDLVAAWCSIAELALHLLGGLYSL